MSVPPPPPPGAPPPPDPDPNDPAGGSPAPASGQPVPPPAPVPGQPAPPAAGYPAATAPGYPAAPSAPQNGFGTVALVMGILQFLCLGPLGSILAIVFGWLGMSRAKQGLATNKGVAKAGFILGIVGLVLGLLSLIVLAILGAAGVFNQIDTTKAARLIEEDISYQTGTDVKVTCPDSVRIEAGATFDCVATAKGTTATVEVTQVDDKGNVTWRVVGDYPGGYPPEWAGYSYN